ncbi:MAG: hypothetical protein HEP71_33805, partial [Roseivirga sp.]|nr:hypothetical protein [Roseivirga sp.]
RDFITVETSVNPGWLTLRANPVVSTIPDFYTSAVALDSKGNIYGFSQNQVLKLSPSGVVSVMAGSLGVSGNGDGTGSTARFETLDGLEVDASGNVYGIDRNNQRVRKITPLGVVTTFAGGANGYRDDTGRFARFSSPTDIAVDVSGNLYVADLGNHRIRKITPAGVVTTFAGSGSGSADGTGTEAQFYQPQGLAVDAAGNVYVADRGNHRIRKITPEGVVSTLAGSTQGTANGTGTSAQFNYPSDVSVDAAGNVYYSDHEAYSVRKITPEGVVSTLVGGERRGNLDGTGTAAAFQSPGKICTDTAGNIYLLDYSRVHKITREFSLSGDATGQLSGD